MMRTFMFMGLMALAAESLSVGQRHHAGHSVEGGHLARRGLRAAAQAWPRFLPPPPSLGFVQQIDSEVYYGTRNDLLNGLEDDDTTGKKARSQMIAAKIKQADNLEAQIAAAIKKTETNKTAAEDGGEGFTNRPIFLPSVETTTDQDAKEAQISVANERVEPKTVVEQHKGGKDAMDVQRSTRRAGTGADEEENEEGRFFTAPSLNSVAPISAGPNATNSSNGPKEAAGSGPAGEIRSELDGKWGRDPRHIAAEDLDTRLYGLEELTDGNRGRSKAYTEDAHIIGEQLVDIVEDLVDKGADEEARAILETEGGSEEKAAAVIDDARDMTEAVGYSEAEPEDELLKSTVQATVEAAIKLGQIKPSLIGDGRAQLAGEASLKGKMGVAVDRGDDSMAVGDDQSSEAHKMDWMAEAKEITAEATEHSAKNKENKLKAVVKPDAKAEAKYQANLLKAKGETMDMAAVSNSAHAIAEASKATISGLLGSNGKAEGRVDDVIEKVDERAFIAAAEVADEEVEKAKMGDIISTFSTEAEAAEAQVERIGSSAEAAVEDISDAGREIYQEASKHANQLYLDDMAALTKEIAGLNTETIGHMRTAELTQTDEKKAIAEAKEAARKVQKTVVAANLPPLIAADDVSDLSNAVNAELSSMDPGDVSKSELDGLEGTMKQELESLDNEAAFEESGI